jgi:hypothetical protein
VVFGYGIGNIVHPSVNHWMKNDNKPASTFIIYMIYTIWFANQLILLIVLLNFVIALISQVYENVMDDKTFYFKQ